MRCYRQCFSNVPEGFRPIGLQMLVVSLALLVFAGCKESTALHRQELPSIRTDTGLAGRTVVELPTGPMILLHLPPEHFDEALPVGEHARIINSENAANYQDEMRMLRFGDYSTFNCVTFALADTLDFLTPNDWVNPFPTSDTFFTCPTQLVLDTYYQQASNTTLPPPNWNELEDIGEFRDGDIVCYSTTNGSASVVVHMGRIKKTPQGTRVISKFGVGPVVESTLEYGWKSFEHANVLQIYRSKTGV